MSGASRRTRLSTQATWFACVVILAGAFAPAPAHGQQRFRPPPNYVQLGTPDQAEGRRILEDFKEKTILGEFYWDFELRVLPRRGEERIVPGRLWGGTNERGPIWRVILSPGSKSAETRLLVQNGPANAAWTWDAAKGGSVEPLTASGLFQPLAGTDLSAFDLQMPFLYWTDLVFEGVARIRGRPAHQFLLYPPAAVAALRPELTGVRVYLDTQYGALVQAEQLGAENKLLKSMTILELKKVDDRWIVKTLDLRDETTRNKTRFSVMGAAMGLDFSQALFEPATLADNVRPPAADRIRRVGP